MEVSDMHTIQQLAALAQVSTRTLRYYDEIQLLAPAQYSEAGYRLYGEAEENRLQQILFYKELGMPLEQIKAILAADDFNALAALQSHKATLEKKQQRIHALLQTITTTINHLEEEIIMPTQEKFEGFKAQQIANNEKQFGKEVRQKYGTTTIDKANAKYQSLTQSQMQEAQAIEQQLFATLALAISENMMQYDEQIANLHAAWLQFFLPQYTEGLHQGIVEGYLADERFIHYYDKQIAEGATAILHRAIC